MAYDLGELGPAQAVSSGLQGLLEAYKLKLNQATEEAKIKQSGYNAAAAAEESAARLAETSRANRASEDIRREALANSARPSGAREETIGGVRYLVRAGARGQEIWTPVINQKGSATQATDVSGSIASVNQAPEYLDALKKVPGGNLGIRATQTPVVGSLFGLVNAAAANAREKRKAFITPYLQAGGGKNLTEGEKKTFEGRVSESSLIGGGTSTQGIQDLTQEIADKAGAAIGTNALGPETGNLRASLDAALKKARTGGALPGTAPPRELVTRKLRNGQEVTGYLNPDGSLDTE